MGREDLASAMLSRASDTGVESSVTALSGSYKEAMTTIRTDVEATAQFMETRLMAANSRMTQNIVNAVEQAFIRKIMDESGRG